MSLYAGGEVKQKELRVKVDATLLDSFKKVAKKELA
jgi:hypothetical protein